MPGKVDQQDSLCKLFIGGITLNTDEEMLKQYYSQWGGEITDVVVMRDPQTKRSRGFGFVTFALPEQLDVAMDNRPHTIDGKEVDPKRAVPRAFNNKPEAHMSVKRIYISGIKEEHTDDMLREHFLQYGNITEVHIVVDKNTGLKRGFAFITYDDYDAADKAVLGQPHYIAGKRCDVKKALSKEETKKVQQQEQDRFQRGQRTRGTGRGAGRGGYYGAAGGQGGDYYGGGGDGNWSHNGYNNQGGWGHQNPNWGQNAANWDQGGGAGWGRGSGAGASWGQNDWSQQMGGYAATQQNWQQQPQGYAAAQWSVDPSAASSDPQRSSQNWAQAAANWQHQAAYSTGAAASSAVADDSSFAND